MRRAVQVLWTLDHLDDLESDFSAVHRIEDMYSLPGPMFFKFAYRMACYPGVMHTLAEIEHEANERQQTGMPSGNGSGTGMDQADEVRVVESDAASLRVNFAEFMDVAEV